MSDKSKSIKRQKERGKDKGEKVERESCRRKERKGAGERE
jgi:hypothetical protein